MRKSLLTMAVLAAIAAPTMAFAEEAKPDYTLAYNVGIFSNYIFRGLTQTAGNPALQGGIDFTHSSGFYAGAWGSNESWLNDAALGSTGGVSNSSLGFGYKKSSFEFDVYGGYRNTIGDTGLSYDLGIIEILYPGQHLANQARADTTEIYGALTYSIVTFKVNYAATDLYGTTNSDGSYYLDLTANYPIPADLIGVSGLNVIGHVGRQKVNDPTRLYSYTDWKLGATKAWENGVTLGGYFTSTTASDGGYGAEYYATNKNIGSNALTAYLTKSF